MFKARLIAPLKTNPFYYSNMNVFYKYVGPQPNCTRHAFGRFAEICGELLPVIKGDARGNAEDWYDVIKATGKYCCSDKPRLGAVACWKVGKIRNGNDGAGHVAVVEEIMPNGDILTSNGAWEGPEFYLETYHANKGYNWTSKKSGKKYVFQGFIYPTTNFKEANSNLTVTGSLHLRDGAGKKHKSICIMKKNSAFVYDGLCVVVDGTKWMHGTYEGRMGWASSKYLK